MTTPSEEVLRIIGQHIDDDTTEKPATLTWIQAECRSGCFRKTIEEFVNQQPEPLRSDLVLVEKIEADKITLRIPGRLSDHESASAFEVDTVVELNPVTLSMKRLGL